MKKNKNEESKYRSRQFMITVYCVVCSQMNLIFGLIDATTWGAVFSLSLTCWFGKEYLKNKKGDK
jgi:hypothetical protein